MEGVTAEIRYLNAVLKTVKLIRSGRTYDNNRGLSADLAKGASNVEDYKDHKKSSYTSNDREEMKIERQNFPLRTRIAEKKKPMAISDHGTYYGRVAKYSRPTRRPIEERYK